MRESFQFPVSSFFQFLVSSFPLVDGILMLPDQTPTFTRESHGSRDKQ
jgi:hypothetical protein